MFAPPLMGPERFGQNVPGMVPGMMQGMPPGMPGMFPGGYGGYMNPMAINWQQIAQNAQTPPSPAQPPMPLAQRYGLQAPLYRGGGGDAAGRIGGAGMPSANFGNWAHEYMGGIPGPLGALGRGLGNLAGYNGGSGGGRAGEGGRGGIGGGVGSGRARDADRAPGGPRGGPGL